MSKKPSLGRQKIKIAKIEIKNHLQVTFSKRRSGLFKKASELCTLCGVEVAIIVFSPAGKVFSFGHPNVEAIVDQFLTRNPPPNSVTHNLIETRRNANLRELNLHLTQVLNELEVEKKRGESMDHMRNVSQKQWWEAPIDELGLNELNQLRVSMEELKRNVTNQTNVLVVESSAHSSPFFFLNNIGVGDRYESKPNMIDASSSIAHIPPNFGYAHGVF